jgi:hypothetical protein
VLRCACVYQYVINVGEANSNPHNISSMFLWNVCAALRRPEYMNVNRNNPKGVVMAVFCTSSRFPGVLQARTRSIVENIVYPLTGEKIVNVSSGVAVRHSVCVYSSIIVTRSSTFVFLVKVEQR